MLDVDELVATVDADQAVVAPAPAAPRPVYDWDAANQEKIEAIAEMATLTETMDDIDARINALLERTRHLELD